MKSIKELMELHCWIILSFNMAKAKSKAINLRERKKISLTVSLLIL